MAAPISAAHDIPFPFPQEFRRVKSVLSRYSVGIEEYRACGFNEVNSGHLYTVLGIEPPSILGVGAHDAAHDARSIAHSMHHLLHN